MLKLTEHKNIFKGANSYNNLLEKLQTCSLFDTQNVVKNTNLLNSKNSGNNGNSRTFNKNLPKKNLSKKRLVQNTVLLENVLKSTTLTPKKNCILNAVFILDGSSSLISLYDKQVQILLNLLQQLPLNNSNYSIIKFGGYKQSKILLPIKSVFIFIFYKFYEKLNFNLVFFIL